jgi:hypothetical protein
MKSNLSIIQKILILVKIFKIVNIEFQKQG